MSKRIDCEFLLLRYVPDPIRGEFINIGVFLREIAGEETGEIRVTRDWSRVLRLDPDADTELLQAMGQEAEAQTSGAPPPGGALLELIQHSFSTTVQTSELRAHFADSLASAMTELLRLYVDATGEL